MSTKSPKSDKQYVWEGQADSGSYTIREEKDPEKLIPRGTRLTLYLKVCMCLFTCDLISCHLPYFNCHICYFQRDDKGFAHPERIQKLLKNYSQFVSFPIYTWQEKGFTKEVNNLFLSVYFVPIYHLREAFIDH